jgi:hypothetical protein
MCTRVRTRVLQHGSGVSVLQSSPSVLQSTPARGVHPPAMPRTGAAAARARNQMLRTFVVFGVVVAASLLVMPAVVHADYEDTHVGDAAGADVFAKLPTLRSVDIWPFPHSVHGGTRASRVEPASFRVGMFAVNATSCGKGCGTLVAAAVARLQRTLFTAEPSTSPYRRASLPPLIEQPTELEKLVRGMNTTQVEVFKVLRVLPPSSWQGPSALAWR